MNSDMIQNIRRKNIRPNALGLTRSDRSFETCGFKDVASGEFDEGMNGTLLIGSIDLLKLGELHETGSTGGNTNLRSLGVGETRTGPVEFVSLINLGEKIGESRSEGRERSGWVHVEYLTLLF
jgi:hypothetical protein